MSPGQCRAARALADLSQDELARRAGVARRTVIRIENGEFDLSSAAAVHIGRAIVESGVVLEERAGLVGVSVPSASAGQLRRAARALLGMSQEDLAKAASVGRRALLNYEGDSGAGDRRLSTVVLVDGALRERGIAFLDEGGRVGVLGPAFAASGA